MDKDKKQQSLSDAYDDGNIPEIDLPKSDQATHTIPQEMPYRGTTSKDAQ